MGFAKIPLTLFKFRSEPSARETVMAKPSQRERLSIVMIGALRSMIGTTVTWVDYHFDYMGGPWIYDGVCDVTDYGIGIETSFPTRVKIFSAKWWSGNDGGVLVKPGYVEEQFPIDDFSPPIRRFTVSDLPQWTTLLNDPIVQAQLTAYGKVVYSTLDEHATLPLTINPLNLEIEFASGRHIYFCQGTYSPDFGFVESDSFTFVIFFDRAKRDNAMRSSGILV